MRWSKLVYCFNFRLLNKQLYFILIFDVVIHIWLNITCLGLERQKFGRLILPWPVRRYGPVLGIMKRRENMKVSSRPMKSINIQPYLTLRSKNDRSAIKTTSSVYVYTSKECHVEFGLIWMSLSKQRIEIINWTTIEQNVLNIIYS